MRLYLAGRVALEAGDGRVLTGRDLGGTQAAALLALLATERQRAVSADEIADHLWGSRPPAAWPQTLRSLVSKLRRRFAPQRATASRQPMADPIPAWMGCYQLSVPIWVDVERAALAIHTAEHALSRGDVHSARGEALVAACISRDPFLPGWSSSWADRRRARLEDIRIRSLEVLADVWMLAGSPGLAVRDAVEVVERAPYRERAYRQLMRAHVAAGNRAEAIRIFQHLRERLAEDLDALPGAETLAEYRCLVRAGGQLSARNGSGT